MPRKSNNYSLLKGGNANTLPFEYYGGDSGRYSVNQPPAAQASCGDIVSQSFGVPLADQNSVGPNLCVYPAANQVGGGVRRRRRRSLGRRRSFASMDNSTGCRPCRQSAAEEEVLQVQLPYTISTTSAVLRFQLRSGLT